MLSEEHGILGGFDITAQDLEALQAILGNILGPFFSDKLVGGFGDIFSIIHSAEFQILSQVNISSKASADIFDSSPSNLVQSSAVHHQEKHKLSVESFLDMSADKINENRDNSVDRGLLKAGHFINFFFENSSALLNYIKFLQNIKKNLEV